MNYDLRAKRTRKLGLVTFTIFGHTSPQLLDSVSRALLRLHEILSCFLGNLLPSRRIYDDSY